MVHTHSRVYEQNEKKTEVKKNINTAQHYRTMQNKHYYILSRVSPIQSVGRGYDFKYKRIL